MSSKTTKIVAGTALVGVFALAVHLRNGHETPTTSQPCISASETSKDKKTDDNQKLCTCVPEQKKVKIPHRHNKKQHQQSAQQHNQTTPQSTQHVQKAPESRHTPNWSSFPSLRSSPVQSEYHPQIRVAMPPRPRIYVMSRPRVVYSHPIVVNPIAAIASGIYHAGKFVGKEVGHLFHHQKRTNKEANDKKGHSSSEKNPHRKHN